MKIQIKNRWYGNVIFECEAENIREACEKAVTEGKSLRAADLRAADLSAANLSDADLSAANLRDANLRDADLEPVRVDFFDVLLRASSNGEVPGLIAALKEGRVDGSTYEGTCACLVGTIANVKHCNYRQIPNLKPDGDRPAERFFLAIHEGDTPENNGAAKLAVEWAEEFQQLIAVAKLANSKPVVG